VAEWEAYEAVEPFGERVDWMRAAMIALTVARSAGSKRATLEDFLPPPPKRADAPVRKQTADEQRAALQPFIAWAKRTGKLIVKKKNDAGG
jgi:hypothetical protein